MNWKLSLAVVAALALCLSACTKEKPKAKPKPKAAECKLAGDWAMEQLGDDVADNKKRVLTLSFADDTKAGGEIAAGTLQVGAREPDASKFNASASVVDTIESGGSAKVDWVWSGKTSACNVKFVSDCEAIEFKCPEGDTFKINRK
jgi:hypothetical protein